MADIPGLSDFGAITLDPNGQVVVGLPSFVVYADLSQPVTLPPGVEYVGPTPVFGRDYGPGIGGQPGPSPDTPPTVATVAPPVTAPPVLPPPSVAPPVSPPTVAPPAAPPSATPPVGGGPGPAPEPGPFRPSGPLPSGGFSPESYGEQVKRVLKDTAKRKAAQRAATRIIEGEILDSIVKRGGAIILGPLGGVIGAAIPEDLGSGELPFPPIPGIDIPLPEITPEVTLPPLPEPPAPVFNAPPTPDVVVVTPTGELPGVSSPPIPAPSSSTRPGIGTIIGTIIGGLLAPRLTPRPRGVPTPDQFVNPAPITNTPPFPTAQPLPTVPPLPFADPLTPPTGEFLPGTTPTPTPGGLTMPQPLVADSGTPQITDPTRTSECNCEDPGQRRNKRKKPRKCLTRANLIWAGGPKAGKPAGSRCIKFEDFLP